MSDPDRHSKINETTGRFKKIYDRTDQQLEVNIQSAIDDCKTFGLDFWIILTGIDAYQEKRRRKEGHSSPQEITSIMRQIPKGS